MPPSLPCMASSTLRPASLTAATIKSCNISTSPSLTASGSILIEVTSFVPLICTVTTPPPAVASTTSASISFCIFSCICCACFIICCMFIPPGNFIALDLSSPQNKNVAVLGVHPNFTPPRMQSGSRRGGVLVPTFLCLPLVPSCLGGECLI